MVELKEISILFVDDYAISTNNDWGGDDCDDGGEGSDGVCEWGCDCIF